MGVYDKLTRAWRVTCLGNGSNSTWSTGSPEMGFKQMVGMKHHQVLETLLDLLWVGGFAFFFGEFLEPQTKRWFEDFPDLTSMFFQIGWLKQRLGNAENICQNGVICSHHYFRLF